MEGDVKGLPSRLNIWPFTLEHVSKIIVTTVYYAVVKRESYGIQDFTHGLKIVVWEGISLQPVVLRKHGLGLWDTDTLYVKISF